MINAINVLPAADLPTSFDLKIMDDNEIVQLWKIYKLGLNVAIWILLWNKQTALAFAVFMIKYLLFNFPPMIAQLLEAWYEVDLNEEEDPHEHQD